MHSWAHELKFSFLGSKVVVESVKMLDLLHEAFVHLKYICVILMSLKPFVPNIVFVYAEHRHIKMLPFCDARSLLSPQNLGPAPLTLVPFCNLTYTPEPLPFCEARSLLNPQNPGRAPLTLVPFCNLTYTTEPLPFCEARSLFNPSRSRTCFMRRSFSF